MWMNEYDVQDAQDRFNEADTPNLAKAAVLLGRLVDWTNNNSDGWPYWTKPGRAAQKLMDLLQEADRFDPQDITEAELTKALSPVKAFLTRQGVPHEKIFN